MFEQLLHQSFTVWSALGLFLIFIILSLITAGLAMMFQVFQQPNMIFYPWAVLIAHIAKQGEIWRHLMRPFGRCRYCNGIWITIYAYKFLFGFNPLIILAIGLNFIFIWVLDYYVIIDIDPVKKVDKLHNITFKEEYTPWQAMMKSYVILGSFYSTIYIVLPYVF